MITRTLKPTFHFLLAIAAISASACGAQGDDFADEEPAVTAQIWTASDAGTTRPPPSAAQTRCALEYAECLVGALDDMLRPDTGITPLTECTRNAEQCGLFPNAPDAGPSLTPTCGFEIADCYLKNLRNPAICQQLSCRKGASRTR